MKDKNKEVAKIEDNLEKKVRDFRVLIGFDDEEIKDYEEQHHVKYNQVLTCYVDEIRNLSIRYKHLTGNFYTRRI